MDLETGQVDLDSQLCHICLDTDNAFIFNEASKSILLKLVGDFINDCGKAVFAHFLLEYEIKDF